MSEQIEITVTREEGDKTFRLRHRGVYLKPGPDPFYEEMFADPSDLSVAFSDLLDAVEASDVCEEQSSQKEGRGR